MLHIYASDANMDNRLDDLIENGLSPYEVRYFRDKLNARPFYKDIFPALPQELQLQVAELLSFDDVLAVFDVSQAWRKMLLAETFVLMVMRVHFASRWYRYSTHQLQQNAEQLSQWLAKAIATCKKVKAGNVLSRQYYFTLPGQSECLRMSDYPTDTEFRRSGPIYSEGSFQYKNSRIAFIHDDGRMIVVKALQKKDDFSLIFMTDDREKFKQWYLSDQVDYSCYDE
ncbi:hypothetical protein B0O99DRAFT_219196 [Bisporella sp. PMI_857]|nr:hypothetical protein B0O99DRAFT_219196 [Bisporella sp. PMI_857]